MITQASADWALRDLGSADSADSAGWLRGQVLAPAAGMVAKADITMIAITIVPPAKAINGLRSTKLEMRL